MYESIPGVCSECEARGHVAGSKFSFGGGMAHAHPVFTTGMTTPGGASFSVGAQDARLSCDSCSEYWPNPLPIRFPLEQAAWAAFQLKHEHCKKGKQE